VPTAKAEAEVRKLRRFMAVEDWRDAPLRANKKVPAAWETDGRPPGREVAWLRIFAQTG